MTTDTSRKPTPLRMARLAQGLSLRELADQIGINYAVLQKLETGRPVRDHEHAAAVYRFFVNRGAHLPLVAIYCPNYQLLQDETRRTVQSGVQQQAS